MSDEAVMKQVTIGCNVAVQQAVSRHNKEALRQAVTSSMVQVMANGDYDQKVKAARILVELHTL